MRLILHDTSAYDGFSKRLLVLRKEQYTNYTNAELALMNDDGGFHDDIKTCIYNQSKQRVYAVKGTNPQDMNEGGCCTR